MKRLLAMTMMLTALPAPAWAAPGFCADLRLLIASLPDRPAVLATRRFTLFRQCRAHIVDFIDERLCTWRPASAAPIVESLAAEAIGCLPGARRVDHAAAAGRGEARLTFRLLSITIGQDAPASGGTVRLLVSIPEG
jgi:hypothetical protein